MSLIIKSGNSENLATVDSLGNLYVSATPAAISNVAAPWTSATVSDTAQILMSTGGFSTIIVQLNQTSTITGGEVTFEGTYDGINWLTLSAKLVLDPITYAGLPNPYTLQANTNYAVMLLPSGFQQVRLRLNSVILGTGQVTIYWTLQANSPLQDANTVSVAGGVTIAGTDSTDTVRPVLITPSGALVTVNESVADDVNQFAFTTGVALLPITVTPTPILSLRPQSGAGAITFFLTGLDVFAAPATSLWQLVRSGTLTGSAFINVPGSNAQADTSTTAISGGTLVDAGYTAMGTRTNIYEMQFDVGDTLTLVMNRDVNGNANHATGALRWSEQTQPL